MTATAKKVLGLDLVADYRERLTSLLDMPHAGALVGKTPGGSDLRRTNLGNSSQWSALLYGTYYVDIHGDEGNDVAVIGGAGNTYA